MRKWVRAFTHKFKIPYVCSGECDQTIREGWETAVGDEILFHGWSGKPYYEPWSWRLRVVVVSVTRLWLTNEYFGLVKGNASEEDINNDENLHLRKFSWDSDMVKRIAERDYVEGGAEGLKTFLSKKSRNFKLENKFQIIRWSIKKGENDGGIK